MFKKPVHHKHCKCGRGGETLTPENEWYVKSPEYSNCFYVYMEHNPRPHNDSEISRLLDINNNRVKQIAEEALEKLKSVEYVHQDLKNAILSKKS